MPTISFPALVPSAIKEKQVKLVNENWGGRFTDAPAAIMTSINASIGFDRRLWKEDIEGSRAHCEMLMACKIIPYDDGSAILAGLEQVEAEILAGEFTFRVEDEDIHMAVESRLKMLIGPAAGYLHTARSRNDQVVTDLRLWLRRAIDTIDDALNAYQNVLIVRAEEHVETIMPGLTHLQSAQPITFGYHLMAYVEMVFRDRGRLADCRRRLNECPLGAGALAGTSFPIDRVMTAAVLGFEQPMANAMDSVSARDFVLEFMAAAAIMSVHLSRLAEELVLWTSDRFRFVDLGDAWSTGSSMMPQKKNPDGAELVKARPGRVIGHLVGLLSVIKGLPLAYGKDMQEDKEPLFDTVDTVLLTVAAMTGMMRDLTVNKKKMAAATNEGFITATDLADYLVSDCGLSFRAAHHVTGRIVRAAEDAGVALSEMPLAAMQEIEPRIDQHVYNVLRAEGAVRCRTSLGGTAPLRVREQIVAARARLS